MEGITKPSLTKLARRSGVKSLSDDCFDTIRNLVGIKLSDIVKTVLAVNSQHNTKTIMSNDIYKSLHLLNYNITESSKLSITK